MRIKNWERILNDAIADSASTKFIWGTSDCIMWSTSIIEKYTGIDLAEELRGTYITEREAAILLSKKDLYTRATEKLGQPLKNINFVQRGDLVLSKKGEMGICVGQKAAFLTKDEGSTFYSISDCAFAWSIR